MKLHTTKEWFDSRVSGEIGKNIEVRPAKETPPSGSERRPCSDSFVPFGPEWEKEVMKAPKAFIIGMLRKSLMAEQSAAAAVPTNWCDPLLTGPAAALSDNAGKWGCPDIERLLFGVKRRIESRQNAELRDRSGSGTPPHPKPIE